MWRQQERGGRSGRGDGRGGRRGGRGGRGEGARDAKVVPKNEALSQLRKIEASFRFEKPVLVDDIDTADPPTYPPATIGTKTAVCANYFALDCGLKEALQYQIEIDCEYGQDVEKRVIDELASSEKWPNGWIYDGKCTMFTAGEIIPMGKRELVVRLPQGRRERSFKVSIAHTGTVSMDDLTKYVSRESKVFPAESLRVLEILMGNAASSIPDAVLHRRSVFIDVPSSRRSIDQGAEVWQGYHQAVRVCQSGVFLNVDSACAPFFKQLTITEFLKEVLDLPSIPHSLTPQQTRIATGILKNLTVITVPDEQKKKVKGLLGPPSQCMFTFKDGIELSVADYFRRTNRVINFPNLPCLDVSKGKRVCYIPPEYAKVGHAQYIKKITERHQEQMVRLAAQKPDEKQRYLNGLLRGYANVNKLQKVDEFKVSMPSSDMKQIHGRILPPPYIVYKEPSCFYVGTDGQWDLGNMEAKFFKGKKLKSWGLLSFMDKDRIRIPGENGIEAFLQDLCRALLSHGVTQERNLTQLPIVYAREESVRKYLEIVIREATTTYGREPEVILVLVPKKNAFLYKSVKRASDAIIGIPTQVISAATVQVGINRPTHRRAKICTNLALKINTKVGGTNSVLLGSPECGLPMVNQRKPYIVIGADVSHSAPGSSLPSIASIVGSLDPMASRYTSRTIIQGAREEMISGYSTALKEILGEFRARNHEHLPESIIVFRDGVSEGFFAQVVTHEYKAIREACRHLDIGGPGYNPPITYICIQKRHHTRLFPRSPEGTHRSGNVKPGTVVDSGITSPFGYDFFLCSQAGIQGTVRPAHYHVLIDENKFGPDALQVMCYWMCYMQCRCTNSVSVPAPVVYADWAAMRSRIIAGEDTDDETTSDRGKVIDFALSQSKMYYV